MTAAAQNTTADPATALDKRRAKWLTTVQAATAAEDALAQVDRELDANAQQRAAGKAALEAAIARAAELEKEIKALGKERESLRAERSRAKGVVRKARSRARGTEKKFDKALIKDMLRKAKAAALSATAPAPVARTRATSAAKTTAAPQRRATTAARRRTAPVKAASRRAAAR